MEKACNGRFLLALRFLGFLGFLGFMSSTNHQHLAKWAYLSLPAGVALLALVPVDKSKVKVPVDPKRKPYLLFLLFLGFLAFLGSATPGVACVATCALFAFSAIKPR